MTAVRLRNFDDTLHALIVDECGTTMVEYGVVFSLLACAAVAILAGMGTSANLAYSHIATNMQTFQNAPPP